MRTYIFGYGSLINKRSAEKTGSTYGEFIPVKVTWMRRHCNMAVPIISMMALWINQWDDDSWVTGVLYEVKKSDLSNYDKREIGYTRIKIDNSLVTFYDKDISLAAWDNIYIYKSSTNKESEHTLSIYRSYIDVCLDWCLDFWEQFTIDFCKSTYFDQKIINDRDNKVYLRWLDTDYDYSRIDWIYDRYLWKCVK